MRGLATESPGYVEHFDEIVREQEPKFLGDYDFEKFIHCALRGSHVHGNGFVVEFNDNSVQRVVAMEISAAASCPASMGGTRATASSWSKSPFGSCSNLLRTT